MLNKNRLKSLTGMICLTGGIAFVSHLFAQDAQQPPPADNGTVIKTETRVVLVDAVVTDKKGGYVRDLKQKDFKVYEDGKEQQIKSFTFEADPNSPMAQQPRYTVLLFDNSTVGFGDQKYARDAAAKFIDANAAPNRLMAVVNYGGSLSVVQNFTSSVARLKAAVSGTKFSAVSPNDTVDSGTVDGRGVSVMVPSSVGKFGLQSLLMNLRAFAKNLATVPGRKSLILFTGGFVVPPDQISELTAVIDACNRANVAIYPIDVRGLVSGAPIASLTPTERIFRPAAFQSQPIFLTWPMYLEYQARGGSSGGSTGGSTGGASGGAAGGAAGGSGGRGGATGGSIGGSTGNSGGTAGRGSGPTTGLGSNNPGGINRGNNPNAPANSPGRGGGGVPVNPTMVDPNARMRDLIPKFPDSASTNQQALYSLADGTGGFVIINTNDLLGGLEKIGKEQNEFYLLGYTPPDSKEGSCHTLHVKVDKGGDNVRARSGYCVAKQKDVLTKTTTEQTLENRAAAPGAGTVAASMQIPYFFTQPNVARVNVAMEISPAEVKIDKDKGKFHGVINILGIAYKPDNSVAARFSDAVKLDFDTQQQLDAFKASKYHYENQFDIASGKYTLKVVFNSGGESFGKLEAPLVVDPYDGKTFMISGLALSSNYGAIGKFGASLDAALIEDRTPLITHGVQVIPNGTNGFKKGDAPAVFLEVYEPLEAQEKPPADLAVALQILILDPKTNATKADSGMFRIPMPDKPGSPVISFATKIPSEEVPAGSYLLQVKAFDSANKAISRTMAIEVQ
jgi:VWFA-related protein